MNRTIKKTSTKLVIETGLKDWTVLLPYALFRARNTPSPSRRNLTPFENLYGAPPPLKHMTEHGYGTSVTSSAMLIPRLKALEAIQKYTWKGLSEAYRPGTVTPHSYSVGDRVYVRQHQVRNLEPRWKGRYLILLTTPTAVKVNGIAAWIHASQLRPAPADRHRSGILLSPPETNRLGQPGGTDDLHQSIGSTPSAGNWWTAHRHPTNPLRIKLARKNPTT